MNKQKTYNFGNAFESYEEQEINAWENKSVEVVLP